MKLGRSKDNSTGKASSTRSEPRGFTADQKAGQRALNDRLACSRLEDRDKDAAPGSF